MVGGWVVVQAGRRGHDISPTEQNHNLPQASRGEHCSPADFAKQNLSPQGENTIISLRKIRKTAFFGGRPMVAPTGVGGGRWMGAFGLGWAVVRPGRRGHDISPAE